MTLIVIMIFVEEGIYVVGRKEIIKGKHVVAELVDPTLGKSTHLDLTLKRHCKPEGFAL